MRILLIVILDIFLNSSLLYGQPLDVRKHNLIPLQIHMERVNLNGELLLRISKDSTVKKDDEATFLRWDDIFFKDGIIEVDVLSRLLPTAPEHARGFIGIAFRINENNDQFECIYIRPTNGRSEQQLRRNRSIQYFSFPNFKFDRLRKEAAGEYESYADMGLDEWIHMKIEVKGAQAKLYLHNNLQPSLIVNDLKLGAETAGSIGMFVDVGTDGYFANLKVQTSH